MHVIFKHLRGNFNTKELSLKLDKISKFISNRERMCLTEKSRLCS